MTSPRQADPARVDGSQEHGIAGSSGAAWAVNDYNGNSNNINHNNQCRVRAVRAARGGECQGAITFRGLHAAWLRARRHKATSVNQLRFEANRIDDLLDLQRRIEAGTWAPAPATCFIATRPKARQIHAPDFGDRVVHHWLVPQLEAVFEPGFIHDSYSNRLGKGTHAAVNALRAMVRQVHSGQGGGWYLQLDIRNFFNTIHRPTLYRLLKQRMERAGVHVQAQRVVHALLRHPIERQGVVHRSTATERARVPAHKRLENSAPGCGIPIGNLSSQFFANVYMDQLDQFVKRRLRVKRYVRYVDDFVLVHQDRAQLEAWQADIEAFLRDELRLALKPDIRLRRLEDGIDFLGYVVFPTHVRVRRRVIRHAEAALGAWGRQHRSGQAIRATPEQLRGIQSTWASYCGHFAQASSHRLLQLILSRHGWLTQITGVRRKFDPRAEHRPISIPLHEVSK